jgi:hypothetical protein
VKKLISIGVALALLALVVLPVGVVAYTPPQTYAKVPFAILASGLELIADLWPALQVGLGLSGMDWVGWVVGNLSGWTYGPLAWSVDMLAWGMSMGGSVIDIIRGAVPSIPAWVPSLFSTVACSLMTCWSATNCSGNFSACNVTP